MGKIKKNSTGSSKVGGQMSLFNEGQAKKWVGMCPPCQPSSYTPATFGIFISNIFEPLVKSLPILDKRETSPFLLRCIEKIVGVLF